MPDFAYHQARYSNAKTETANLIVVKQRRAAHGYRNFNNYRSGYFSNME